MSEDFRENLARIPESGKLPFYEQGGKVRRFLLERKDFLVPPREPEDLMADEPERPDGHLPTAGHQYAVAERMCQVVARRRPVRVQRDDRQDNVLRRQADDAAAER